MTELLSLPEEDTKKFIEQQADNGTPVADMSVKTFRKEIKKWKSAREEVIPIQTAENKPIETIDITPSTQNHDDTEQTIHNEPENFPLDNSESPEQAYHESQQPTFELQQPLDKITQTNTQEEPPILETSTELQGTYLIEELSNTSVSLIQHENKNEIIQTFAKNNPN